MKPERLIQNVHLFLPLIVAVPLIVLAGCGSKKDDMTVTPPTAGEDKPSNEAPLQRLCSSLHLSLTVFLFDLREADRRNIT